MPPVGESLPTPVARLPPRRRRGRGAGLDGRGPADAAREASPKPFRPATTDRPSHGSRQPVIDLSPVDAAVPDAVVERISSARRVLAVGHENPDADTLGSTLASAGSSSGLGGRANAGLRRPGAAALRLPARHRDAPGPIPSPTPTTTCSSCRTAGAWSASAPSPAATRSCSSGCRGSSSTITPRTASAAPADWIDPAAAATCEMTTLLAARLGVPLDEGDGALAAQLMAGIVMDTATFAHPNTTPRTLAVSAALVEAGAPLSDISRRLYRSKPEAQLRLFGVVLGRLETAAGGRIVHSSPVRRRPDRRPARSRLTPRASSTCLPRPTRPSRHRLQGGGRRRRESASARSPAASTRPF